MDWEDIRLLLLVLFLCFQAGENLLYSTRLRVLSNHRHFQTGRRVKSVIDSCSDESLIGYEGKALWLFYNGVKLHQGICVCVFFPLIWLKNKSTKTTVELFVREKKNALFNRTSEHPKSGLSNMRAKQNRPTRWSTLAHGMKF